MFHTQIAMFQWFNSHRFQCITAGNSNKRCRLFKEIPMLHTHIPQCYTNPDVTQIPMLHKSWYYTDPNVTHTDVWLRQPCGSTVDYKINGRRWREADNLLLWRTFSTTCRSLSTTYARLKPANIVSCSKSCIGNISSARNVPLELEWLWRESAPAVNSVGFFWR